MRRREHLYGRFLRPRLGQCTYVDNGSCIENPKTLGYWQRVCRGNGNLEDAITDVDVSFMRANSCGLPTIIHSVDDICRILGENQNDSCWKAEQEFIALNLNLSRRRVSFTQGIDSQCSAHTQVYQAYSEADVILCTDHVAPPTGDASCDLAACECKEINQGRALHVHCLVVTRLANGTVRIAWIPPMADADDLSAQPRRYRVWRASAGSGPFVQIAEVPDPAFDDTAAIGVSLVYDVTPLW